MNWNILDVIKFQNIIKNDIDKSVFKDKNTLSFLNSSLWIYEDSEEVSVFFDKEGDLCVSFNFFDKGELDRFWFNKKEMQKLEKCDFSFKVTDIRENTEISWIFKKVTNHLWNVFMEENFDKLIPNIYKATIKYVLEYLWIAKGNEMYRTSIVDNITINWLKLPEYKKLLMWESFANFHIIKKQLYISYGNKEIQINEKVNQILLKVKDYFEVENNIIFELFSLLLKKNIKNYNVDKNVEKTFEKREEDFSIDILNLKDRKYFLLKTWNKFKILKSHFGNLTFIYTIHKENTFKDIVNVLINDRDINDHEYIINL